MYAIVHKEGRLKGKRAKHKDGSLTPVFKYSIQGWNYIGKRLDDTPYLEVKKILKI